MSASLDKLEELYSDILAIVRRQVTNYQEQDELDEKALKSIEICDKIVRAAIEKFENKKPKGEFAEAATEDLS